jgi:hypothetical protein
LEIFLSIEDDLAKTEKYADMHLNYIFTRCDAAALALRDRSTHATK